MTPNEASRAQAAQKANLIRPLAAERMSAVQIASYLQMTKGQVVGLCYRHGIKLCSRPERRTRPPVDRSKLLKFHGVPLRERGCRWPAWGNEAPTHLYCGADKAATKPYCEHHLAMAYRAPEPVMKQCSLSGRDVDGRNRAFASLPLH